MVFLFIVIGIPLIIWAVCRFGVNGDRNLPPEPPADWDYNFRIYSDTDTNDK